MATTLTYSLFCPQNTCAIVMSCHILGEVLGTAGLSHYESDYEWLPLSWAARAISAFVLTVAIVVDDR